MSNRFLFGAVTATGAAVLMLAVLQPAGYAGDTSPTQFVDYHEGVAWPLADLSVINDRNRDQLNTASELVDYNKDDFSGSFVDENSQLIVVVSTARGFELAAKALGDDPIVTIRQASLSPDPPALIS